MHIAGDGDMGGDIALMIPLWIVLQTNKYAGLPAGKKLLLQSRIK